MIIISMIEKVRAPSGIEFHEGPECEALAVLLQPAKPTEYGHRNRDGGEDGDGEKNHPAIALVGLRRHLKPHLLSEHSDLLSTVLFFAATHGRG